MATSDDESGESVTNFEIERGRNAIVSKFENSGSLMYVSKKLKWAVRCSSYSQDMASTSKLPNYFEI